MSRKLVSFEAPNNLRRVCRVAVFWLQKAHCPCSAKKGPRQKGFGRGLIIYILKYHLGEQSHVKRQHMCRKASGLRLPFLSGGQGRILKQRQGCLASLPQLPLI
jgi:hypothetical protein